MLLCGRGEARSSRHRVSGRAGMLFAGLVLSSFTYTLPAYAALPENAARIVLHSGALDPTGELSGWALAAGSALATVSAVVDDGTLGCASACRAWATSDLGSGAGDRVAYGRAIEADEVAAASSAGPTTSVQINICSLNSEIRQAPSIQAVMRLLSEGFVALVGVAGPSVARSACLAGHASGRITLVAQAGHPRF